MVQSSKILTVSYGTFSCTLEGFDDPFSTMTMVAEYFRDLSAEDRYFGSEPPVPDPSVIHSIASQSQPVKVDAEVGDDGVVLRPSLDSDASEEDDVADEAAPAPVEADAEDAHHTERADDASAEQSAPDDDAEADGDVSTDDAPVAEDAAQEDAADDSAQFFTSREAMAATEPLDVIDDTDIAELDVEPAEADQDMSIQDAAIQDSAVIEDDTAETPTPRAATSVAEKLERIREVVQRGAAPAATAAAAAAFVVAQGSDDNDQDDSADSDTTQDDVSAEVSAEISDDTAAQEEQPREDVADADAEAVETPAEAAVAEVADTAEPADDAVAEDAAQSDVQDTDVQDRDVQDTVQVEDTVAPVEPAGDEHDDTDIAAAPIETAEDNLATVSGDAAERDDVQDYVEEDDEHEVAAQEQQATAGDLDAGHDPAGQMDSAEFAAIDTGDAAEVEQEPAQAASDSAPSDNVVEFPPEDAPQASDEGDTDPEDRAFQDALDAAIGVNAESSEATAEDLSDDDAVAQSDVTETDQGVDEVEDQPDALLEDRADDTDEEDTPSPTAESGDRPRGLAVFEDGLAREEEALERLLETTRTKLTGPDAERRRDAMRHLRAAVAATEAERASTDGQEDEDARRAEDFRRDLERVREAETPQRLQRTPRPSPLVLVSEQRVDIAETVAATEADPETETVQAAQPSIDTAVAAQEEPEVEDHEPTIHGIPLDIFRSATSFGDFADRIGASDLPDLLEAAAAYTAYAEGRPRFSRAQVMAKLATISPSAAFSKEAGLRSFGKLLREGKILRVQDGQFSVSRSSRYAASGQAR